MSEDIDIEDGPPAEPPTPAAPERRAAAPARSKTKSLDGQVNGNAPTPELILASFCMEDRSMLDALRHLPDSAFKSSEAKPLWAALRAGVDTTDFEEMAAKTGLPAMRLFAIGQLAKQGGSFSRWSQQFEQEWRHGEFQRIALEITRDEDPNPESWARRVASLSVKPRAEHRGLFAHKIPADGDKSVLLGDRYLNRGDGMILSCSSGMGKSSMARQMMASWALGRDFHGIKPNGPLRSLEIQAEDSEGDIGEVSVSIRHAMKLSDADVAVADERCMVVTERIRQGADLMAELRTLIARHKPDIVWINPLYSYLEGDITEARDLSAFLSGGLNALNSEAKFAYIVVHHTTKPPKGKDKVGLAWNEIMYDMAGGAVLINWARAIISLRPAEASGDFNLVLAKRGTRAGVTREVEQGAGMRLEIVTTIPLRWSQDIIELPGRQKRLRCIFWESRAPDVEGGGNPGAGRPPKHSFEKFQPAFPRTRETAMGLRPLHRKIMASGLGVISAGGLDGLIDRATAEGLLIRISREDPRYYLP